MISSQTDSWHVIHSSAPILIVKPVECRTLKQTTLFRFKFPTEHDFRRSVNLLRFHRPDHFVTGNGRRQHGHSPSNPLTKSVNAAG